MRIRDRVMSHNARAMFASLPLETSSDTNIEFLAGNRDSRTNLSLSFFFLVPPPLLFLLRPFSGAPSRDTPLDSASLKRIITVIKRIKVIPVLHFAISRIAKSQGDENGPALVSSAFPPSLIRPSSPTFRVSRVFLAPSFLYPR